MFEWVLLKFLSQEVMGPGRLVVYKSQIQGSILMSLCMLFKSFWNWFIQYVHLILSFLFLHTLNVIPR